MVGGFGKVAEEDLGKWKRGFGKVAADDLGSCR